MSDDEGGITQPQPTLKIMQSVAITPMPEFCPDAKLGTSLATKWEQLAIRFRYVFDSEWYYRPNEKTCVVIVSSWPKSARNTQTNFRHRN